MSVPFERRLGRGRPRSIWLRPWRAAADDPAARVQLHALLDMQWGYDRHREGTGLAYAAILPSAAADTVDR